jgi:hypothetical protein
MATTAFPLSPTPTESFATNSGAAMTVPLPPSGLFGFCAFLCSGGARVVLVLPFAISLSATLCLPVYFSGCVCHTHHFSDRSSCSQVWPTATCARIRLAWASSSPVRVDGPPTSLIRVLARPLCFGTPQTQALPIHHHRGAPDRSRSSAYRGSEPPCR